MDPLLKKEVRFITTRLGDIIREQAGASTFGHIEQLRRLAKTIRAQHDRLSIRAKRRLVAGLKIHEAYDVAHAFSLFFQLTNLCEERARVRHLQSHPAPAQSLRRLFRDLKEAGVKPGKIKVVGIGGIGDALKAIKEGWMYGTVLQSPITEGDFEAQRAIEFLKTGKLNPFYKIMDNPKIDPKNVGSYKSEF